MIVFQAVILYVDLVEAAKVTSIEGWKDSSEAPPTDGLE